jgi:hypothetical protein
VRAEASGGAQGHGGVDAEFAGFVAGGGDNAALVGTAADDNGLAAEVGTIEEFDGDEECVHVHVEDGRHGWEFGGVGGVVLSTEASQVRHGVRVRLRGGGSNERGGAGGRVVWKLEFDGGVYLSKAEALLPRSKAPAADGGRHKCETGAT